MKQKNVLALSLLLNIIFLASFATLAFIYRDKLAQRYVTWKGQGKIVMYGNSITAQGKWVELLGRTDVINSGLPGQCTYTFLDMLQSQVIDLDPEICFVMGGINDITVGVSPEKLQKNYQSILESLVEHHITPVVTLTLYERKEADSHQEVKQLNEFLIKYCNSQKIAYLDLNQYLCDSAGLKQAYSIDKTHLNYKAYQIWAGEISKILTKKGI
ncbi:GDSL-type esterase/lipase family protein [Dyadobacter sp. 32]|uniref:SGNH/GDSL hydrolase family protein n=1 Tax=Dyadobacter sp. 32 TaxID=538966 RepID=UPI0011F08845